MDALEISRVVALEDRHWWYKERRAILARELVRLGRPGKALDVGAAGGGNTRVLVEHGWDATAVDFSEDAVAFAESRGLQAMHADLRCMPLDSGGYDLIVAFDVLEHIDDDKAAANEIARMLRQGGTALVAVPCDMRLWSAHDVALGHYRRYTRQTLGPLLEGAGLAIERMWSWNVLMRPVARWRRRNATGCDLEDLPTMVNAAVGGVVKLERYLPVGRLPGVSLMVEARLR